MRKMAYLNKPLLEGKGPTAKISRKAPPDFSQSTCTRNGYPVSEIRWNEQIQKYIGSVAAPGETSANQPTVRTMWHRNGSNIQRGREDLWLKDPAVG